MKLRHQFGWFLAVLSLIVLALFVISLTIWRFAHPELTETQLALWSLERWWSWGPAAVIGGVGLWLARDER